MDIQALRLRLTDDDVSRLIAEVPEDKMPVRELRARLTAEGVLVEGKYPTVLMSVSFQMRWQLEVVYEKVQARLSSLDFSGVPAGPFRGMILGLVREELADTPGVTQEGETITVDVAALLSSFGPEVHIRPREVRHEDGALVLIAGD